MKKRSLTKRYVAHKAIAQYGERIKSATKRLLDDEGMSRQEQIDLASELNRYIDAREEKEKFRRRLGTKTEKDPNLGWYLHQRSQSGFELPPDAKPS